MNQVLASIASSGVIDGVAKLIREVRQPALSNEDFGKILMQRLDNQQKMQTPEAQYQEGMRRADLHLDRFIQQRDVDGDGILTRDESGLVDSVFETMDTDGDKMLSRAEMRASIEQYVAVQSGLRSTHGNGIAAGA